MRRVLIGRNRNTFGFLLSFCILITFSTKSMSKA